LNETDRPWVKQVNPTRPLPVRHPRAIVRT
jgi:hypothetical protein